MTIAVSDKVKESDFFNLCCQKMYRQVVAKANLFYPTWLYARENAESIEQDEGP